jgi:hypothetical protein
MPSLLVITRGLALESPGQQLLDRFLIGYPRGDAFHKPADFRVALHEITGSAENEIALREKNFGLSRASDLKTAAANASAIIIAAASDDVSADRKLFSSIIDSAPSGCRIFNYGAMRGADAAIFDAAARKQIAILSGTTVAATWTLPQLRLPLGDAEEILVAAPAPNAAARVQLLEAALRVSDAALSSQKTAVEKVAGAEIWESFAAHRLPHDLLAAALSRSDSPQGLSLLDGRTQDLGDPRVLRELAPAPHGWIVRCGQVRRTILLDLDGAIGDLNFAARLRGGAIVSAQILRTPAPADHAHSLLAAAIEDWFRGGAAPWPAARNAPLAEFSETLAAR